MQVHLNLKNLGQARILTDPYSVMLETIRGMENASGTVFIVNSRIASPEYIKLSFEKAAAGLKVHGSH
jgi:hypothetical protein